MELPQGAGISGKIARGAINSLSGAIPIIGGLLSAGASAWSEAEQDQVNKVLQQWLQMLEDELREKGRTIAEVIARIEMDDEKVAKRVESPAYQALLKKAFRNWSSVDSEGKREKIRNILSHAAASSLTSDDVVKLFMDWIATYSDFHFEVIGQIFNQEGITRGGIWQALGKPTVREDSAEADLFKLLIRDLSTGSVIRQHRQVDYYGNFQKKQAPHVPKGAGTKVIVSAFDQTEGYELTGLGKQFVHYAMTEIVPRISFSEAATASSEVPHSDSAS